VGRAWPEHLDSLVAGHSPAVLTTYRRDSSAVASPVWFRFHQDAFEVVVAEDDVQLRHLTARPSCGLVVFEARAPVPVSKS
jgi:Pyridoxamine 5'-phosphate oxidase